MAGSPRYKKSYSCRNCINYDGDRCEASEKNNFIPVKAKEKCKDFEHWSGTGVKLSKEEGMTVKELQELMDEHEKFILEQIRNMRKEKV